MLQEVLGALLVGLGESQGVLLLDLEGRDGEPRVSCQTGHTLVIGQGCGHLTVGSVWVVL